MLEKRYWMRIVASLIVVLIAAFAAAKIGIISWQGVLDSLQKIGIQGFALALGMAIAQYVCIAVRFVVLLARQGVSPLEVCRVFTNGQLLNHLFPARAGDLYKVLALKRASDDAHFSTAHVVSALILERLLSTLVLLSLVVAFVDWSRIMVADLVYVERSRQLLIAALAVSVVLIAFYLAQKRFPRLRAWLRELGRGFLVILNPRRFIAVVCLSLLMWTLEVLSMKFVAAPLNIDLQLGQGYFVLMLLNIGIAVPVTLGNIGTYEAALVLGLGLWGVGTSEGIAIAMSHHFLQIASLVILAGVFGALNAVSSRPRAGRGRGAR